GDLWWSAGQGHDRSRADLRTGNAADRGFPMREGRRRRRPSRRCGHRGLRIYGSGCTRRRAPALRPLKRPCQRCGGTPTAASTQELAPIPDTAYCAVREAPCAALWMVSETAAGCVAKAAWLAGTYVTLALIRSAMCRSIAWS